MSRNVVLSSEEALDNYFSALLDEPTEELEPAQEIEEQPVSKFSKPEKVVPQLQKTTEPESEAISSEPIDTPNLDDIQRLLDRLETTDPLDDLTEVEALIEQNTINLSAHDTIPQEAVEEIQEWVVEEPATAEFTQLADETTKAEEVVVTESQAVNGAGGTGSFDEWASTERNQAFQVLFFDVLGVMFAVPLDELGGIHRLENTNHLLGRPSWYLGLQTNRDSQLDVVDTARWVMPDKLSGNEYKETYQYIVMLGDSFWGLACGELKGTELVRPEQVRWREVAGKRPWLAGMVKDKMCALIHVEALIQMLQSGLDVKALNNL